MISQGEYHELPSLLPSLFRKRVVRSVFSRNEGKNRVMHGNHVARPRRTIIRKVCSSQGYVNDSPKRFPERFPADSSLEFPYEQ